MPKPVLLAVDDDAEVVRSVERDLRRKYGARFRVLRAESGLAALDILKQLKVRNEDVALLLADQRMPGMSGVEFLAAAMEIFPGAKRALLTAYADTNAAISAINSVRVDYYLLKPWDPPEQHLYPVLDDMLDDWQAGHHPAFEGLRLIGQRWSPESYALKDFLGRNQIPYQWIDVDAAETNAEAKRLLDALDTPVLPLVLYEDGTRQENPDAAQVAEKLGLRTRAETSFYDLVIVGGGPAGLAAGVYGASEGLKTIVIEREAAGGQAGMSSRIENYLGFPNGVSGEDLARRAVTQAKRFGCEILAPQEACSLRIDGPYRIVKLSDGEEVNCHALLIATGLTWKTLNVPGIERLTGAGVYYGSAMTEALSCKDEEVYVVGGANSAGQAAMYFSLYARRVTMLVRAGSLEEGMSQYLVDQIRQRPNIKVRLNSEVTEAHGNGKLDSLTITDRATEETGEVPAASLFIFIGAVPCTAWLHGQLELDDRGYILAGRYLMKDGQLPKHWTLDREPFIFETSVPGVFVAGDTRHGSVKRVASGVGEGAMTVQMIHQYLAMVR